VAAHLGSGGGGWTESIKANWDKHEIDYAGSSTRIR
jgi:hypothetical protein